jgi:tryptophan 2,3-dioxygenase
MVEAICVRELGMRQSLNGLDGSQPSAQLAEMLRLAGDLPRLAEAGAPADLAEAATEYLARQQAFHQRFTRFAGDTLEAAEDDALDYAAWLRLDDLLALQTGVKSDWAEQDAQPAGFWLPEQVSADENLFIIVHQCFEVYFKAILSLVDDALPAIMNGDLARATHLLRRAVAIQRLMVPQIQIPATMLPRDFMLFREQKQMRDGKAYLTGLTPASGTESYQFREIEIVCGLRTDPVFQRYLAGTDKLPIRLLTPRQQERLKEPGLADAFDHAVRQRGLEGYDAIFTPAHVPNANLDLALLADALLDFDEFFHFWRLGHVNMVQKMIGTRSGTGFLGPEYLAETVGIQLQEKNRIFEDRQVRPRFFQALWRARGGQ